MTPKQYEVIEKALHALEVQVMYDDFESLGRIMTVRRRLAEILGTNVLSEKLLPHEDIEYVEPLLIKHSEMGESFTEDEKKELGYILQIARKIAGCNDSDDACLRCGTRMLAELVGENLHSYRLLYEKEVKPLYYQPE